MSFSYSAGVITQTGTDTDLSGLSGLTGVTTTTSAPDGIGSQVIYSIDSSTRLVVGGTLSHDPDYEQLIIARDPASTGSAPMIINGTYNYGVARTGNGNTQYSIGAGLVFTNNGTNFFSIFAMVSNGTFTWKGGVIKTAGTLLFANGSTVTVDAGTMVNSSDGDTYQFRLSPGNSTNSALMTVNNITLAGTGGKATRFFTTYGFANAVFKLTNGQVQTYNGNYPEQTYTDFDNIDNINSTDLNFSNYTATRGGNIVFKNVGKRVVAETPSGRYGYVRQLRVIELNPVDLGGTDLATYSYHGTDFDSGNRVIGANNGGTDADGLTVDQDDTDTKVYTGIDSTGAYSDDILIQVIDANNTTLTVDDRTSSDTIPIKFIGYNESISTWADTLTGLGTLSSDIIMTPDLSISQATRATVDAYTTLETPEKFYDRAKSYICGNFTTYQSPLATRSGSTIDAGSYDVEIDATAVSTFAFNGSKITIKATTFTGNITTTGDVTLLNGATIVGSVTDASGTSISITATFNNLVDATVEVFNSAGTSVGRATAQTGTYIYATPLGSTGTWTYIVDRIGYQPLTGSFAATGSSFEVDGTLTQLTKADGSAMYTASTSALINIAFDHITPCMCINIGDGSVSAQTVFDESEQALLTADGMRWQSKQGSLVRYDNLPGVGNILFMEDYVRLKRASVGDVNSAVAGYVLSSDGTVVDGVNGGVAYVGGFNVDDVWNATTRTLTSGTKDSEIDSILADTNELQTNQGQWLTATGFATPTNVTDAQTAIIASVDGLNDFDPALDVVANVTTVGTCTTNTDMRGTDNAATQASLDALNDFDPLSEDVTLANNAITSSKIATNAFTNSAFTTGYYNSINAEVDTALGDYDAPTKAEMDSAFTEIKGAGWSTETLKDIRDNVGSLSEANLHAYLDTYTNKGDWRADISALASQASIDNLNDLSASDIDARLLVYDAPTLAEMTSAFTEIKGAGWTTSDTLEAIKDSIGSGGLTAADVWTYATRGLTEDVTTDTASRDASKATIPANILLDDDARLDNLDQPVSSRSTFDPASDTVANVTTVQTNVDMRGTDGANTVAPDNVNVLKAAEQSELARKHLTNRDKIDTTANTLTRYDDDGVTSLVVFDLKDADGNSSSDEVFEKDPQ
jgi:hypothetical protein